MDGFQCSVQAGSCAPEVLRMFKQLNIITVMLGLSDGYKFMQTVFPSKLSKVYATSPSTQGGVNAVDAAIGVYTWSVTQGRKIALFVDALKQAALKPLQAAATELAEAGAASAAAAGGGALATVFAAVMPVLLAVEIYYELTKIDDKLEEVRDQIKDFQKSLLQDVDNVVGTQLQIQEVAVVCGDIDALLSFGKMNLSLLDEDRLAAKLALLASKLNGSAGQYQFLLDL